MLNAIAAEYRIREARAYIDTRNLASIKMVQALGFQLAATVVAPDDFRGISHEEHLYLLKIDS
jgi:RimJ/RimL family protein N-acetyltransferase